MTDFGGKLRQAREQRGASLRQIAASTKISIAALEALERNDFSRLPGGIFSRAFVRSYAVEVGLDPDDTVREFLERLQQQPATPAASSVHATPGFSEDESSFESRQRVANVLLKIIIASFVAAAVILYLTWRHNAATPQSPPAQRTPASDAARPTAQPRPAMPPAWRGAALQMQWTPASDRL